MRKKELVALFESKYLAGTCFDLFKDLMKDKTDYRVNVYRAFIAIELKGVWRGLQELLKKP